MPSTSLSDMRTTSPPIARFGAAVAAAYRKASATEAPRRYLERQSPAFPVSIGSSVSASNAGWSIGQVPQTWGVGNERSVRVPDASPNTYLSSNMTALRPL